MKNMYDGILKFKGTWRVYQKRVLDHSEKYLEDGKIHIVAAPGSGKTTLGIELIRRLGAPCLILSPSITIRQQWLERIKEGFLMDGQEPAALLSNDLRQMKPITAITYQALHGAMKRFQGELKDEDGGDGLEETTENVDFSDFHLFDAVAEAGIRTICLDEAHHLRSEWWKALENFLKQEKDMTVISLTATPPYDSTPGQWKRYIDMCGPIDEEIFTPELVREGSLCPHEDYICFNWPAKEELKELEKLQKQTADAVNALLSNDRFSRMIAAHKGLKDPEGYSETFLERPEYFSSLLIFCQDRQIPFPPFLKKLIGAKGRLPKLDSRWLQVLLQGFLFDDTASYDVSPADREAILGLLKDFGCVYRKKVILTHTDALQKLLAKSQGKMESIGRIVECERRSLGEDMRLLILCDYIKKDKLSCVGNEKDAPSEIGAVPIFEYLRRMDAPGVRLGCLSGSVIIVPMDVKEKLEALLADKDCVGTLQPLKDTGYGRLQVKGRQTHVVSCVTEVFRQGGINALVGTKSLLGEGWDAPCVNSLILATYVGAFMLSNQMRGRAIRTDREHPEKTGNIWHLACVFPKRDGKTKGVDLSGDFETLARRFEAFLGVSWKDPVIESGIERLDMPVFDTKEKMEQINQTMFGRASDRAGLRAKWENALKEIHGDMEVEQVEIAPKEEVRRAGSLFINILGYEMLAAVITFVMGLGRTILMRNYGGGSIGVRLLGAGFIIAALGMVRYGVLLLKFYSPEKVIRKLGQAVLDALVEIGEIEDGGGCRAETESPDGVVIATWLKGGTMRDKTTFAACMEELWGVIDNPRYLLVGKRRGIYHAVPEVFGKQKDRVVVFEKHARKVLGRYRLVYTRTPQGRQILLKARTRSFVNRNLERLTGKKVAKGRYE